MKLSTEIEIYGLIVDYQTIGYMFRSIYHEVLYQKSIQHKFMVKSFKNNIILITDSKK